MAPRVLLEQVTNPVQAFALFHFLDAHGVPVSLSDPPLRFALGEIPYLEMPYTLFLHDPEEWTRARSLIKRFRDGPPPIRGVIWRCGYCGEEHEPEFGACWKCDSPR